MHINHSKIQGGDLLLKNRKLILSLVLLLFVASIIMIGAIGCGDDNSDRSVFDIIETGTPTPTPSATKSWTFLVYMAADNNLEDSGLDNIDWMEQAGSTDKVNIVVQFDRNGQYDPRLDWTGCRRYYINYGTNEGTIDSTLIQDMGDVDTGDYNQFTDFVKWGMANYPAERYAVVLWNHGSGWRNRAASVRGICWDDTSDNHITEAQMRLALSELYSYYGKKIQLVAMDACVMGNMEVAYDVKDYANYLTFSQINEPGSGYPYNTILTDLITYPTMTEAELASTIVTRYGEYYTTTGQTVTQSAVNLSQMDALVTAVNNFSTTAQAVMTNERANFIAARTNTVEISSDNPDYKDLYEYMDNVQALTNDATVQAAAASVKTAHANAVVAKTDVNLTTHGLSIWLPTDQEYASYIDTYRALAYGAQMWDEFLEQLVPLTH